jgi:chromosomal replication initiator protein
LSTTDPEIVAALELALVQQIGAPRYQLWFAGKTRFGLEPGLLTVGVPNRFYQDYLDNKFGTAVRAAVVAALGEATRVRFVLDAELFQAARRAEAEVLKENSPPGEAPASPAAPAAREVDPASAQPSTGARKRNRRWYQLGDFVVGPCNRLAHAAALSIVEAPGQHANPLVLHGPVGTGKTHLLEGIYAGLRKAHPNWRVSFITAEAFTNRFLQAMHQGKLAGFRAHFRDSDALLVDDLDFLAGKRATQDEFLHTFDVLHSDGKQVVVSCDCHPRLADDFSAELTDRLLGGAVWGLTPPEPATRLALLRAKATSGEPPVPDEVLSYLADQLRGNVRELEGALHSVRHFSRVTGRPVQLDLAQAALTDLLRHAVRVVQLSDVEQAVCRALRLEAGALRSKQRAWAVSHPRMLAIFLARKHTRASYSEIGQHFGGRNHSTAVAAEKKVRQWLAADGELVLGGQHLKVRDLLERIEREMQR